MTKRTYWRIQVAAVLLLAAVFASPHVFNYFNQKGQGMVLMFSTDDGQYEARVRAALLGRVHEVGNGMTGGVQPAKGASPALQELVVGTLFRFTHLKAPQVMVILTVFITPLIVFLLVGLLRSLAFSPLVSLLGAFAYLFVFLSALQKPVNMSLSLPITIGGLLLMQKLRTKPTLLWVVLTGVMLGLIPWVYFWSWTFVWCAYAALVVLHLLFVAPSARKRAETAGYLCAAAVAVFTFIPFFVGLLIEHGNPAFIETAFRSTIIRSHWVESTPRFIALTFILLMSAFLVRRNRADIDRWLFPFAVFIGIYCAMYQNIIHGIIFSFSSHFYPFVCLGCLLMLLYAWSFARGTFLQWCVILTSSVFLVLGVWDYRAEWSFIRGDYYLRNIQHMQLALHILDSDHTRDTVLTDRVSANMVTTWTDDDALFTPYVRHILVSDREYAQRYCLSELFNPKGPDIVWLAHEVVERPSDAEYAARETQFHSYCDPIRKQPMAYLKQYDVTTLLWNERLRPDWRIRTSLFTKEVQGDGWSLWTRKN